MRIAHNLTSCGVVNSSSDPAASTCGPSPGRRGGGKALSNSGRKDASRLCLSVWMTSSALMVVRTLLPACLYNSHTSSTPISGNCSPERHSQPSCDLMTVFRPTELLEPVESECSTFDASGDFLVR